MSLLNQLMEQKKKVDFNSYDLSIKELLSMVNDGLIDIAPDYQRQFRWDDERQSNLIESLFLGISRGEWNNGAVWNVIYIEKLSFL